MASKYITVFIPTYNGQKYIGEIIEAVLHQNMPDGYKLELMIIDSGSSDKTVDIIKNNYLDKINFSEIPNSEFGHGKTRQQAAKSAKGEYVLFLSHDATPTHYNWVKDMIAPFTINDDIGCVFGRQIPRIKSVPTIKREVSGVFDRLGHPNSVSLWGVYKDSGEIDTFFSDVNSAVRKDLITKVPFRDVRYAEDQALAEDLQRAGFIKAYSASASVWHSNELTIREFRKRKFDEYIGLQESVGYKIKVSVWSMLKDTFRETLKDWSFTIHDKQYSLKRKIYYLPLVVGYNYASNLGKYQAIKYIDNHKKRKQLSLEENQKQ